MKRVLILEDEEILGGIYTKKLEQNGFIVCWVKSLKDLKENVKHNDFDIIILDNGLKDEEKSGLDVISEMRKLFPHSYILMLSNYSQGQFREEAVKEGANEYLVKMNTSPKILVQFLQNIQ